MSASADCPDEVLYTVDAVEYLLKNLDVFKTTSPDGVSVTMLKHSATSIAPSVTKTSPYHLTLYQPQKQLYYKPQIGSTWFGSRRPQGACGMWGDCFMCVWVGTRGYACAWKTSYLKPLKSTRRMGNS